MFIHEKAHACFFKHAKSRKLGFSLSKIALCEAQAKAILLATKTAILLAAGVQTIRPK